MEAARQAQGSQVEARRQARGSQGEAHQGRQDQVGHLDQEASGGRGRSPVEVHGILAVAAPLDPSAAVGGRRGQAVSNREGAAHGDQEVGVGSQVVAPSSLVADRAPALARHPALSAAPSPGRRKDEVAEVRQDNRAVACQGSLAGVRQDSLAEGSQKEAVLQESLGEGPSTHLAVAHLGSLAAVPCLEVATHA